MALAQGKAAALEEAIKSAETSGVNDAFKNLRQASEDSFELFQINQDIFEMMKKDLNEQRSKGK
ncbi:hypothetical protein BFW01_g9712 [Lasiodiplodia theobromae]|nr:hypothetical protein BFW01_g9712 [Lasiodiplodia theobromae]